VAATGVAANTPPLALRLIQSDLDRQRIAPRPRGT
jgi:hypothetical protein